MYGPFLDMNKHNILTLHLELNVPRETISSSRHQGSHQYALALDRARMIPSLPYKLYRTIDFGLFVVMAIREAIKENVLHASAPHVRTFPRLRECNATLVQST